MKTASSGPTVCRATLLGAVVFLLSLGGSIVCAEDDFGRELPIEAKFEVGPSIKASRGGWFL